VFLRWPGSPDTTAQGRSLNCVELGDLAVAEHARGRGAGRMLLEAAEALAAERGHDLIGLEVTVSNPFNEGARALYQRQGYRDAVSPPLSPAIPTGTRQGSLTGTRNCTAI
jgi:GNAT superfamily N-acetyltransferase